MSTFTARTAPKPVRPQKLARYGVLWIVGAAYLLFRIQFLGAFAPNVVLAKSRRGKSCSPPLRCSASTSGSWSGRFGFSPFTFSTPARARLICAFSPAWRFSSRWLLFSWFAGAAANGTSASLPSPSCGFLATLAPVLNAHWVGENVFTERYLYLPSVGVAWLVGLGATKLWSHAAARPAQRRALALAGVTVGVLYAARIVVRNRDWNNDIVFYTRTLEFAPEPILYFNLGAAAGRPGKTRRGHRAVHRSPAPQT